MQNTSDSDSNSSDDYDEFLSEYVPREIIAENPQNIQEFFDQADDDSNLSEMMDSDGDGEHLYLGRLKRVSGFNYLEPYKYVKIILLKAYLLMYPGEIIPIILPRHMSRYIDEDQDDGLLFGIIFHDIHEFSGTKSENMFGVTCQIYEQGFNEDENFVLKARACQRFVMSRKENESFPFDNMHMLYHTRTFANVLILPEIILPDPQLGDITNSCSKFRINSKMSKKIRRFETGSLSWPCFVYDQYDIERAIRKIIDSLPASIDKDTIPKDLTMLSFWCAKNILLDAKERIEIFRANSAVNRLFAIRKSIDNNTKYFDCRKCKTKITTYNSVFTMSRKGVQSNYCNPSGVVHELNTVYNVYDNTVETHGRPSTQFSWFPGYAWQIITCTRCKEHLGWKFIHLGQSTLSTFFGLSGTCVSITKNSSAST